MPKIWADGQQRCHGCLLGRRCCYWNHEPRRAAHCRVAYGPEQVIRIWIKTEQFLHPNFGIDHYSCHVRRPMRPEDRLGNCAAQDTVFDSGRFPPG